MKKLLRIITALICLSPFQAFAMEKPEAKPIRKRSQAVPASDATQAFFAQVFTDYELDPSNYRVLTFNDPKENEAADANDLLKKICVNEATNDNFDVKDCRNWAQIYTAYHEVGHLKDKAMLKKMYTILPASLGSYGILATGSYYLEKHLAKRYPHSLWFNDFLLNISDKLAISTTLFSCGAAAFSLTASLALVYKLTTSNTPEIRADNLACQQLLQKEWGMGPIASALLQAKYHALKHNKCFGHDHESEYNNIVQLLEKNGYQVESNTEEKSLEIAIGKNGQVVANCASGL